MEFLRALAKLRTPFWDEVMSLVTHLGEETLFIVVALAVFWCMDKKRGYFLLFTGFSGILCNQFLKMLFRIPRPWVLDPEFEIVESARAEATGYSFPSGHTQSAATLYGGMARTAKRWWSCAGLILLCAIIAFSRLYLGVHTPLDVGVSLGIGVLLICLLYPVFCRAYRSNWGMYVIFGALLLLAVGNVVFLGVYPFPADTDADNLTHALDTGYKMLGMILVMPAMYALDRHIIRFQTDAPLWAQLVKLAGGFAVVMAVRLLLKAPLNALLGSLAGGAVRYALMVLTAGVAVPYFFKFLPQKKN